MVNIEIIELTKLVKDMVPSHIVSLKSWLDSLDNDTILKYKNSINKGNDISDQEHSFFAYIAINLFCRELDIDSLPYEDSFIENLCYNLKVSILVYSLLKDCKIEIVNGSFLISDQMLPGGKIVTKKLENYG